MSMKKRFKMDDSVQSCVQMRADSQEFMNNFKKADFTIKKAAKAFLLENDGTIFCLETSHFDVIKVLLAQLLINLKEDEILKENLNEILFADFSSFTTLPQEQNQVFLMNFPNVFLCTLDNEEQLEKHFSLVESWIKTIKGKGKKIIFIQKNWKHLEKLMVNSEMANMLKLKLDQLSEENEMESNNEVICTIQSNLVENESTSAGALDECTNNNLETEASSEKTTSNDETAAENADLSSARALDECTNNNLETEASSEKTTSNDKAAAENADLTNLLQSLGVEQLDAVDEDGDTQLHLGAHNGKLEIVQSLLSHGAKNDVKNNTGETALHLAAWKGHSAVVNVLLEHGFDVNATNYNYYHYTPLHYACLCHNDAHMVEILLKFGVDIERKCIFGQTALHYASCNGLSAVVNSLLKNGADINVQDKDGDTPLHLTIYSNHSEVVLILLQHGALFTIKNNRQETAIDLVKFCKNTEIMEIFENFKRNII